MSRNFRMRMMIVYKGRRRGRNCNTLLHGRVFVVVGLIWRKFHSKEDSAGGATVEKCRIPVLQWVLSETLWWGPAVIEIVCSANIFSRRYSFPYSSLSSCDLPGFAVFPGTTWSSHQVVGRTDESRRQVSRAVLIPATIASLIFMYHTLAMQPFIILS